jgi:hypothetical protein
MTIEAIVPASLKQGKKAEILRCRIMTRILAYRSQLGQLRNDDGTRSFNAQALIPVE